MQEKKPLKAYKVSFKELEYYSTIIARTPAAARYQYWRYLDTGFPYKNYLNAFKTKCLGLANPEHIFGDKELFDRMCKHRFIEFAYMGMTVDVDGEKGIIVGSNSSMNLNVLFPERTGVENCHPHWQTTYYNNNGEIIKCFKEERTRQ
jgi:hypothetical protein